jgi:hypothetical protein
MCGNVGMKQGTMHCYEALSGCAADSRRGKITTSMRNLVLVRDPQLRSETINYVIAV